jgi:hypothetical protein
MTQPVDDRARQGPRGRQRYLGLALLGVAVLTGLGAWAASGADDAQLTFKLLTIVAFGAAVFGVFVLLLSPPRPGGPAVDPAVEAAMLARASEGEAQNGGASG